METRLLNVFFGADRLPYKDSEHQIHFPLIGSVINGASNVDIIRFYVDQLGGDENNSYVAIARLPSGTQLVKLLDTVNSDSLGHYVDLYLSEEYTAQVGDLYISLNIYGGGIQLEQDEITEVYTVVGSSIICATGMIKLTNAQSPNMQPNYNPVSEISVQEALGLVSTKADKDYVDDQDSATLSSAEDYTDERFATEQKVLVANGLTNKLYADGSGVSDFFRPDSSHDLTTILQGVVPYAIYDENYGTWALTRGATMYEETLEGSLHPEIVAIYLSSSALIGGQGQYFVLCKSPRNEMYGYKFNNNNTLYGDDSVNVGMVREYAKTLQLQDFALKLLSGANSTLSTIDLSTKFYDKSQIDSIVSSIKSNEFQIVSELPSTGEEGIIYLLPVDPNDSTKGYHQYIWEDSESDYVDLGTTAIDLSNYYTKTQVDNLLSDKQDTIDSTHKLSADLVDDTNTTHKFVSQAQLDKINATTLAGQGITNAYTKTETDNLLSAKENVSNKTTTLSASSTDTQYPSAKVVYDKLQDIREIAEGKCKAFVLSYQDTISSVKAYLLAQSDRKIGLFTKDNGTTDITSAFKSGDYDNYDIANDIFSSTTDSVNAYLVSQTPYILCRYISGQNSLNEYDYFLVELSTENDNCQMNIGDIVWVLETEISGQQIPDRWLGITNTLSITFYKMQTNIDVSGLVDDRCIAPEYDNTAVYNLGAYCTYQGKLYRCTTAVSVAENFDPNKWTEVNVMGEMINGNQTITGVKTFNSDVKFNNSMGIDSSVDYDWRIYRGSRANWYIGIVGDSDVMFGRRITPSGNNIHDVGSSTKKWKDIWVNNIKGVATFTQAQYDALVSGGTIDSDTFYFIEE